MENSDMYIPKEDNTDEISDDDSPRVDSIPENTDIFSPGGKSGSIQGVQNR